MALRLFPRRQPHSRPRRDGIDFRITRPIRISIMLGLFLVFFTFSPAVILYTAGYRFSWQDKAIKKTGVISLDAEPTDAEVLINGIAVKGKMPLRLANRAPGSYRLVIRREGYIPWSTDIVVASNQTTFIKDVRLFKQSKPERFSLLSDPVEAVYAAPDADSLLALTYTTSTWRIMHVKPSAQKTTSLAEVPRTALPPTVSLSPDRTAALIISGDDAGRPELTLIDMERPETKKTVAFGGNQSPRYQWSQTGPAGRLFIEANGTLEIVSPGEPQKIVGSVSSPVWFAESQSKIWTLQGTTLTSLVNGRDEAAYTIARPAESIIDANQHRIILGYSDGLEVMKFKDGRQDRVVSISGAKPHFHPETRTWWVYSDWEVWSVYDNGDVSLLRRNGEPISVVRALDRFGVMLLANDQKITGFNPGYYVSQELARTQSIGAIDVDTRLRRIYFTDQTDEAARLMSLEY
ncbi:MAG: hypothetical protein UY92_C0014G0074 [Candidatus Magasanikbacteria bacterium GW2011_GWA2_56_11]|uniref:PEGA domain-containing protein n=1 Tax=Candidatus Magasanikbacteria bacterium GW2011_GWA2_56_11 TaxID=1619044 RepID=A0A0G2B8I2_9BACT|nr:MAG: hypothetical protein UY92_C0014G0074 [Candidatus Magasanikbacteria bacterium GW2011_GWA2_56_11]